MCGMLDRVADNSDVNCMTTANLALVFGPTLMKFHKWVFHRINSRYFSYFLPHIFIVWRECFLLFSLPWVKGKGFPYSIPSVGPKADPVVQAVGLQVTVSHPPSGRLPLLSARPAVSFPSAKHRPLAGTKWQRHIGVNNLPKVVTQHCSE